MSKGIRPSSGAGFLLLVVACFGGLVCSFPSAYRSQTEQGCALHQLELVCARAPELKTFGIENFESIDKDGDGILSGEELLQCTEENKKNREAFINARYLLLCSHLIGHEIEKRIVDGKEVTRSGISRKDLETMVQRLNEMRRRAR